MSGAGSPASKTERLLNLVLVLLRTRRPLSKQAIRGIVPQYAAVPTDEAFERMFERDKDELRELGVPLVTEDIDTLWESDPGYRIHERDYALPDIAFTPQELTVLGLASRTWAQGSLAGPAAQALRKLRAAGLERDDESLVGIEPRLRTNEPAFDAVKDAVVRRVPITFDYRRGDGETSRRTLEPWGLASWRGRWYVTGFDRGREAERVFRLSRVTGPVKSAGRPGSFQVPQGHDAAAAIRTRTASDGERGGAARLRVRSGRGHALRRRGRVLAAEPGWDLVEVPYAVLGALVDEVVSSGPDVVAVHPPALRERVVDVLRRAADAHLGEPA